ncbi:MAG: aldo/keto reductase [Spongiibacteraceae bacterium]
MNARDVLPKRQFGSTGIAISVLGLGTVKLGRNQGVKYPQHFEIPDDDSAADLIAQAKDLGINLIDTAPAYGNSEERLGKLLKGQRRDWIICTKVGEEFESGKSVFDFSAEHTRYSVERSLQRLQTDILDIVLIHSDGNDLHVIRHSGALETLARCKQQGLVRAFGVSTKTVAGGIVAAELSDGVMATYNALYADELPVLEYCAEHSKGVLIKKALASGHFAGSQGISAEDSLRTVLAHRAVSSAIVGTINPQHLRANIQTAVAG